jgi:hypothetical protein
LAPEGAFQALAGPAAPSLGVAASFAVLGGSTVTNTGSTTVSGNVGVSPGIAVTGFPPGLVSGGSIHLNDGVAAQAQADTLAAYNTLAGLPCDDDLSGQDLGGMTLTTGVYCFTSSAQLTGTLTLNAEGDSAAVFIFQIDSALTTASNATVEMINSGDPCSVYWQVGSSATLGTGTDFAGNILADQSITLTTNANVQGRLLAINGAVTLDTNDVAICPAAEPTPTATDVPPTATDVPPTATDVPPTATDVPPTPTDVPPTATDVPPMPTDVPPTATGVPPTPTDVPPTATTVPPTPTDVPPTATTVPPTPTVEGPTPTAEAPTPTAEAPTPTAEAPTPTVEAPTPTMEAPTPTMQAPTPTMQAPTPTVQAPTPTVQAPTPTVQAPTPTAKAPTPVPQVTAPTPTVVIVTPTSVPTVVGFPATGGAPPQREGQAAPRPASVAPTAARPLISDALIDPSLDLHSAPVAVPLELRIPSLQMSAPVLAVGVTSQNVMDTPQGPGDDPVWQQAFWYRGGAVPGDLGTATIGGHVSGIGGKPALFKRLAELRPGDLIIVHNTQSDLGARFMVTEVAVYPLTQAADAGTMARIYGLGPLSGTGPQETADGLAHLTLITCSGEFVNGSYDHRLVVYAQRTAQPPTGDDAYAALEQRIWVWE